MEAAFRGAGWNVIKVIWGEDWDPLLAQDEDDVLVQRMTDVVDGQYQKYSVESGAYTRDHFCDNDPRMFKMFAHLTDEQIRRMRRGGHDTHKVYAAYDAAVNYRGSPPGRRGEPARLRYEHVWAFREDLPRKAEILRDLRETCDDDHAWSSYLRALRGLRDG